MSVENKTITESNNPLLRRAYLFIEEENWDKAEEYLEKVLDSEPENVQAYLGKMLVDLQITSIEGLREQNEPLVNNENYKRIIQFADDELKGFITEVNNEIIERNESLRLNEIYNKAKSLMESATTEAQYEEAKELFDYLKDFKDSKILMEECIDLSEKAKKDAIYQQAESLFASEKLDDIEAAKELYKTIPNWRDANEKVESCDNKIESIKEKLEELKLKRRNSFKKRGPIVAAIAILMIIVFSAINTMYLKPYKKNNETYKTAVALLDDGKYVEAIEAFESLDGFKDSNELLEKAVDEQYAIAMDYLSSEDYKEAYSTFMTIQNYRDASARLENAYDAAVALLDDGKYVEAIEAFEPLDGYKDSNELLEKAVGEQYAIAEKLLSDGKYEDSFKAFKPIQNYKDVSERLENFVIMPSKGPSGGEDGGFKFKYDKKGRLVEIEDQSISYATDVYTITYSSDGKILKMVEKRDVKPKGVERYKEKEVFDYSKAGKIKLDFETADPDTSAWGNDDFKGEYTLDEYGFPLKLVCKRYSEYDKEYYEYYSESFNVEYDNQGKIHFYGSTRDDATVHPKYDEFNNFTGFEIPKTDLQMDFGPMIVVGYNENKVEFERQQIIAILLAERYIIHLDLYMK